MKILITAGGTKEPIDDVRYIANHSTGKLGSIIAQTFAEVSTNNVTYIHGYGAIVPSHPNIHSIEIFSTEDLKQALQNELTTQSFDAVIHSMAVSDYTMANAFSQQDLLEQLESAIFKDNTSATLNKNEFSKILTSELAIVGENQSEKKLSSSSEHLMLRLKKTPKIIQLIKEAQPDTLLVGFKLLVDVTEDHLIAVASALMEKNKCDYVLANDLTSINGDKHRGLLIGRDKHLTIGETKQEIAANIVNIITNRKKEN